MRRVRRQDSIGALDQQDTDVTDVNFAKIVSNNVLDNFTEGARQLHAGRPATHYDKGQPLLHIVGIGLAFSRFERLKDAPANIGGILDGLQARRERLPFLMAEVMKSRTAGDDQSVVIYLAVGQDDSSVGEIKIDHLG